MDNYRCYKCNSLLYKAQGKIDAEVICHKCRAINYPLRSDQCLGLRGQDFQRTCIDHRCDNCNRLLVKTNGDGVIEIKCKYCKHISEHDTMLMRQGKFEIQRTAHCKKLRKSLAQ
jgi:phage FluMu protein Com